MEINSETKFKLELIVNNYSSRTFIDKSLLDSKIKEDYFEYHKNKLQDEILSLNYAIKELGRFCANY